MSEPPGQTDAVRRAYDAVSHLYRSDDETPDAYREWIATLLRRLSVGARVLDLGCGCGVPVSRMLAEAGCSTTGVDVSDVQVERARRLVPGATFLRADMTQVVFDDSSFDGIVCLYAVIHVPLHQQPALLARMARWLKPGGVLLMTAGWTEWTGSEDGWLGGPDAMWWSHADADTYRRWLLDAGFSIEGVEYVPEGDGGHSLFWATTGVHTTT